MSEQDTQTVAEKPDAVAQQTAEGADARDKGDDLDQLLNEFDTSTKAGTEPKSTPEQKPGAAADPNLAEEVKTLRAEFARMASKGDMDSTIKTVRGELDPEVFDDDFVEAWLDGQARKDPRLQQAWAQRHSNPKQFDKVKTELGRNFAKRFTKLPDKGATEDREAVTDAVVRGASTKAPPSTPPDYSKMSDREFADSVEKQTGIRPPV